MKNNIKKIIFIIGFVSTVCLNANFAFSGTWGAFPSSAPLVQSTNIAFSNITRTSMTIRWTRGDGDNCLLLARESYNIPETLLADNTSYTANSYSYTDMLNSSVLGTKVLYNGNDASPQVNITNMAKYKLYYFKACEYSGNAGEEQYLQTSNDGNPRSRWTLRKDDDNQAAEAGLNIFPNPANDKLNCTIPLPSNAAVVCEIYSLAGQLIKTNHFGLVNSSEAAIEMNVSNLQNGAYLLKISNGTDVMVGMFDIAR